MIDEDNKQLRIDPDLRTAVRLGKRIKLRDARRIDFMLESASMGMKSGLRDAVTKEFEKIQRQKKRDADRSAAAKARSNKKRAKEGLQSDIRVMLSKRFKRD